MTKKTDIVREAIKTGDMKKSAEDSKRFQNQCDKRTKRKDVESV